MNHIPKELQSLVYWAIRLLGQSIKDQYGTETFNRIEKLRKQMKTIRAAQESEVIKVLQSNSKNLGKLSNKELYRICHAFSLMLELINRCESAYRYSRLQGKEHKEFKNKPYASIFVFTAHPTEARNEETLQLFRDIYEALIEAINYGRHHVEDRIRYILSLALYIPMARNEKPSVKDEAQYLYSYVLREEIISQQIDFYRRGIIVHFRSWVGGDKDGHPGVDHRTLLMSLGQSRKKIIFWLSNKLKELEQDIKYLGTNKTVEGSIHRLKLSVKELKKLEKNDGKKVQNFKRSLISLNTKLKTHYKIKFHMLDEINILFWLYPALVMPLEIREDSQIVKDSIGNKDAKIYKMLQTLKEISNGHEAKWYVRGFVLSQTETADDIEGGYRLILKVFKNYVIPIVPLFETASALENSCKILEKFYEVDNNILKAHKTKWSGRFEVMLGYSDSSKESGVLPSRYLIHKALYSLDRFLTKHDLTPVFFHGNGGSIERGGGSIKEQTEWWPKSAVNIFKATTQGEMIARNFQSDLIMQSQIEKIIEELNFKTTRLENNKVLEKFQKSIQTSYQALVNDREFKTKTLPATPYSYLNLLKIGSRPQKREVNKSDEDIKIRAIPWVLCWTQTRILMPTWWGVGKAFSELDQNEKEELKVVYQENKLLASFFKVLGFTLRKVELPLFLMYLERHLEKEEAHAIYSSFKTEYESTIKCFEFITGESDLLWFRPWLSQSIYFRSSMIHPLNLIQLEALNRKDEVLLRETVTGIACGMMTTG